jgi:hypothetical protein
MIGTRVRRTALTVERRIRTARVIAKALKSRRHPILAQIVPIRRCNLSCASATEFDVNVNMVLGAATRRPADALVIARRALALGFGTSVGLIHDGSGRPVALDAEQQGVYRDIGGLARGSA